MKNQLKMNHTSSLPLIRDNLKGPSSLGSPPVFYDTPEEGTPLPPAAGAVPEYDPNVLMQDIQELTTVIREHEGNFGTLDIKRLEEEFKTMIEQVTDWQQQQLPPARLGIGNQYQSDEILQRVQALPDSNMKRLGMDIVRDGKKKMGRFNVTGADIVMTHHFLATANALKDSGQLKGDLGSKVQPVSAELEAVTLALMGVDSVEKLMDAGTAGAGAELIPTGLNAMLWEDFFAPSKIVADMNIIPMPTDPFKIPLGLEWPTWRKGAAGVPVASQDLVTADATMTSTELVVDIAWTYDLDELSIVAMMPTVRNTLNRSGAEQMDAFVLNADATDAGTGNINSDDANPDADAYFLSNGQDGIRHLAIIENTGQLVNVGAAISDAGMASILLKLGKYGLDYQNVRIVPEITTYFKMLAMTNVATVDKYGPMATVLAGELGRYRGIPIIPSASMPKTEDDGKVSAATPANNVKGQIAAYHRGMWSAGFPRTLLVEADKDIRARQLIMVASFKIAVAGHGTRSSAVHTAVGRNITIT